MYAQKSFIGNDGVRYRAGAEVPREAVNPNDPGSAGIVGEKNPYDKADIHRRRQERQERRASAPPNKMRPAVMLEDKDAPGGARMLHGTGGDKAGPVTTDTALTARSDAAVAEAAGRPLQEAGEGDGTSGRGKAGSGSGSRRG